MVDDASPGDRWLEVLAPFRGDPRLILWRSSANGGPYRIKNVLLEKLDSPIIALQDADDRSHPERFARQLAYMDATGADIVGCWARYINEAGRPFWLGPVPENVTFWRRMGLRTVMRHPTAIMRRSVFELLVGFDGTTMVSADEDFIFRAAHVYNIRNVRSCLYDLRTVQTSLTRARATGLRSEMRLRYEAQYHAVERERRHTTDRARLLQLLVPPPNDRPIVLNRVS